MTKKPETFLDFIREFEEKHNTKVLIDLSEGLDSLDANVREVIPTGSSSLDACLGIGGIPMGRITQIAGKEGSGKTTLTLNIIKQGCLKGIHTLYIDNENTFDESYAFKIVGKDLFREYVLLVQPDTAEQVLEIAGKGIMSKEFGIVVLDSIGDLSPKKEKEEEDFDKQDVALLPRLVGKFLRIYKYSVNQNNIALILLNQVRANIGTYMGGYSLPGGYALAHDSSIILQLAREKDIKDGEQIIGINVKFVVKKNKLAPPFRSSVFPLVFSEGIDSMRDLIDFASGVGIIKTGGPYYKYNDLILGRGVKATKEYLLAHPELIEEIRQKIFGVTSKYKEGVEGAEDLTLEESVV